MSLTTPDRVKGTFRASAKGSDYDGTSDLLPFIRAASVVVARVKACAATKGLTLTADELIEIETWLACHFYCSGPDKPLSSKSTGGASGTFQGQTAMGLDSTLYGQMAMRLDYSGCLTAIDKRQFASMTWAGKTVPEQVDYEDRN